MEDIDLCDDCDVPATHVAMNNDRWHDKCYCDHHTDVRFGTDPDWRRVLAERKVLLPIKSKTSSNHGKL